HQNISGLCQCGSQQLVSESWWLWSRIKADQPCDQDRHIEQSRHGLASTGPPANTPSSRSNRASGKPKCSRRVLRRLLKGRAEQSAVNSPRRKQPGRFLRREISPAEAGAVENG